MDELNVNELEQFLKEVATEQKKFVKRVKSYDDLREAFGGILTTIYDLRMYLEKDPRQIIRNLDDKKKEDLLSAISAWQSGIQLLERSLGSPASESSIAPMATLRPS
jgi:hypothetical protein